MPAPPPPAPAPTLAPKVEEAPARQVAAAAPPAAPAPPRQNVKILTYLDNLRVTGIRAAGADSRVLMNDRVYRVNDMVDYELALRLTGVSTTTLTFVDDNGVVYTKTF